MRRLIIPYMNMRRPLRLSITRRALGLFCTVFGCASPWIMATARAQSSRAPEWTTDSFNSQRDGWQRYETAISPANAKNLQLLWKLKTDNKTMGMQSFREPLIIARVHTAAGNKTLAIVAGSANDVYAIDADTGTMVWQKKLKWSAATPQESGEGRGFICTNALSATPVVTPSGEGERFLYVLASDRHLHILNLPDGEEQK